MPDWSDKAESLEHRFKTAPERLEDTEGKLLRAANKPQMMVALCFANGRERFFSYAELAGADVNGHQLQLFFYTGTVTITGTKLGKIADAIRRHVVPRICETQSAPFDAVEGDAHIERITIGPPALEQLHGPVD